MTNNTEQQAVPVAQEDREAAHDVLAAFGYVGMARTVLGGRWDSALLECRHRLASLPCKSGEGAGEIVSRLKYDAPQGTGRFELNDPEPANHHSALYLVDPNGAMFNISCWDEEGVDTARGEWMRDTLNAALPDGVERPGITAAEINALPDNIRRYIMMLETDADPSGTIRSEMILRDYVELLEARINEVNGCFDAAVAEGLYERLQEAEPNEHAYASLVDLVQRRLLHAYTPAPDRPALTPDATQTREAELGQATQPATSQEGEKPNRWYADAPKNIWLHGIGGGHETTWADDPSPTGDAEEEAHAVGYVRDDLTATPTPPTLNSWANTPEAEHERILLMAEIELHLQSCCIFLTTREKMHPVGVDIHDELLAKVTAAIEATGSEKAHG